MSNATAIREAREVSTEAVLQNHLRAAKIGVDAVMQDYTERSVLITADATYRGRAEIRGFFTTLFSALPAGFLDELRMIRREINDDVAYILWECKPQIPRATDTFVMRNGKILVQTFAAFGG
jgi:ketosteroid isomerase-like protein